MNYSVPPRSVLYRGVLEEAVMSGRPKAALVLTETEREELTALTSYQQAYAAGARLLTVVDKMYQALLDM